MVSLKQILPPLSHREKTRQSRAVSPADLKEESWEAGGRQEDCVPGKRGQGGRQASQTSYQGCVLEEGVGSSVRS